MRIKYYLLCAAMLICGSIVAQEHHYQAVIFENNMTFRARVCIDGVEQQSIDVIEIGAFNGDVCTDSKFIKTFGSANYYRVNMTIGGVASYPLTFKLYNHTEGQEEEMLNYILTDPDGNVCESLMWANDQNYGSYKSPYTLNFIHSSSTLDLTISGYGDQTNPGGYYLIAPPFGEVNPGDVTYMIPAEGEGSFDLYYFDQTQELEWINIKDGNTPLQPGKGYLYAREQGATLTFSGTPITESPYVVDLVYDENADLPGWNLIGNPYATQATLDQPFYRLEEGGSEVSSTTESTSINAMEGVFVHATAAGTATFTTGSKSSQTVSLNLVRNDRAASLVDRAIVRFDQGGTLPKFMLDPTNTRVYIPQDGEDYAVATCGDDNVMPVSFKAKENGSYTLKVSIDNVEMGYLHLIDNKTGNDIDLLATPSYTFEANSHDYAERFSLVYATTDGLNESFAFFNGSNWIIENGGKALLQVVDVTGRVLRSEQISGNAEIDLGNVAGVYVLRLINGNDTKVQKVVVR